MAELANAIKEFFYQALNFIKNPEQLSKITIKAINILFIFLIAKVSIRIFHTLINKFFDAQKDLKVKVDLPRLETMKSLMMSIVKYTVYFVAFTAIIKALGTDVTALITAAGIGGLAFGFGAQNLVRDVITGFFILFEDQFAVGSYVKVGEVEGIVEEMAIRVTKIRDFNGDLHTIPNGEIKTVTNKSRGKMRAWVDISIAYEEDIDKAIQVLNEVCEKLKAENKAIIEGPTVLGVTQLGPSEVVISAIAKTIPMEQWAVERLMRKSFKEAFDHNGIEIPYPRRVIITKSEDNPGGE